MKAVHKCLWVIAGDKGDPALVDHQHAITQIEGLQVVLNGKSPIKHKIAIADVSQLQTAQKGKISNRSPAFTDCVARFTASCQLV